MEKHDDGITVSINRERDLSCECCQNLATYELQISRLGQALISCLCDRHILELYRELKNRFGESGPDES